MTLIVQSRSGDYMGPLIMSYTLFVIIIIDVKSVGINNVYV